LRNTPALVAAPVATARVGAIARVDVRAGAWTRVETVEGTGWIAASQLRSLARE